MRVNDPAYLISLTSQTVKRHQALKRLVAAGFGVQPHIVDCPTKDDLRVWSRERTTPRWAQGRRLNHPGELGCLLSHKWVLERIVETRLPSFVFEDDVLLHKGFRIAFANLAAATNGHEWIYLGANQKASKRPFTRPAYTAELSLGTFAYWLTPERARDLLVNVDRWAVPIDQYYARWAQPRFKPVVAYPMLCIADVRNKSATGHGKRDIWKYAQQAMWTLANFELPSSSPDTHGSGA